MHPASLEQHLRQFDARECADADHAFLARLYASTRTDLFGSDGPVSAFGASLVAMQQRLQASGYRQAFPAARYLVLAHQGRPAGRLVVDIGPSALRLVDIALLPELRGLGLGTRAIRALQAFAAERGLAMTLAVHRINPGAARLYRALGFTVTSADTIAEQMRWC
ncbi:MAG: GNAT family N-acetyltransferase [Telluria sp.]